MEKSIAEVSITKISADSRVRQYDKVVVEEPLEIHIEYFDQGAYKRHQLSVTMRTPGFDKELVLGFLLAEGIIKFIDDVGQVSHFGALEQGAKSRNKLLVKLNKNVEFSPQKNIRNFFSSASCGVCGRASIESLRNIGPPEEVFDNDIVISSAVIKTLPAKTLEGQKLFGLTGGIHSSGVFTFAGEMILCFEDVGRHNSLDKAVGRLLMESKLPASDKILFLSGRTGFELVQKAYMAGISVISALGSPSSLAVELADTKKITLIGFNHSNGFNIYTEPERIH